MKERAKNLTSLPIPLNRQEQQLVLAYSRTCTIDCFKASHLLRSYIITILCGGGWITDAPVTGVAPS